MLLFLFKDGDLYMFIEPKQDRRRTERRYRDRRLLRCEREVDAAVRITSALFEHLALDELVVKALQIAIEVANAECGSILLADPGSERLIFHHSIGISSVPSGTAIPWDKGLALSLPMRTKIPVISSPLTN